MIGEKGRPGDPRRLALPGTGRMIHLTPHVERSPDVYWDPNPKLSISVPLTPLRDQRLDRGRIAGLKVGRWFDHETGENGGPIQLDRD